MYEVIRWITLGILWLCIALNVYTLISGVRLNKQLKRKCAIMEQIIKDWREKHADSEA